MKHPCLIIAHRGASAYVPENSLASAKLAISMRADLLEFDVLATADHVIVLHHNRGIKVADGKFWLDKITFAQAKIFKPDLVTFEELVKRFGKQVGFHIDIKQAGIETYVVEILKKYAVKKQVVVGSGNLAILWRFKELYPECMTSFFLSFQNSRDIFVNRYSLLYRVSMFILPKLLKFIARPIIVWRVKGNLIDAITFDPFTLVNKRVIEDLHQEGVLVLASLVNTERDLLKILELGVDGVITDRPDLAREIFTGRYELKQRLPLRIIRGVGRRVKNLVRKGIVNI